MEAKKFLFKSSSIFSVAILLASLTTFGSANAQEMQNKQQTVNMENSLSLEMPTMQDYLNLVSKAEQVEKNKKVIFHVAPSPKPIPTPKAVVNEQIKKVVPVESPQRIVNVTATAYISSCGGCSGITSTGLNISNTIYHNGYRIIATDSSLIPTYSIVRVTTSSGESFLAQALDKGGAIHGHIIDVLVGSESIAINFGRQSATITILREGA